VRSVSIGHSSLLQTTNHSMILSSFKSDETYAFWNIRNKCGIFILNTML